MSGDKINNVPKTIRKPEPYLNKHSLTKKLPENKLLNNDFLFDRANLDHIRKSGGYKPDVPTSLQDPKKMNSVITKVNYNVNK